MLTNAFTRAALDVVLDNALNLVARKADVRQIGGHNDVAGSWHAITALPCAKTNSSQLSFVTVAVSVCHRAIGTDFTVYRAAVFTASTVPEN